MSPTDRTDEIDQTDAIQQKRRVLATLTLIVLLLAVVVPAALYSLAPVGPVTEGHLVYANGRHEVQLAEPTRYHAHGYGDHCYLEPRERLRVIQRAADRPDRLFLARIDGRSQLERPFCPPEATVLLATHQFVQRLSLWDDLRALVH